MTKEDLELAEEHINLAEDIIVKEAKNAQGKEKKALEDAAFALEKAGCEIEEA